jgi:inosine/xanthosine triphosphatase
MTELVWAVGTTNKAKLECVRTTVAKCFPKNTHSVVAVEVVSAVSAQPMSAEESVAGAIHRAQAALAGNPTAQFGVGLEGGVEKHKTPVGEKWFECGWMAVVERSTGRIGIGSSARFEMSSKLMNKIIHEKKELAQVMDELTGQTDVRSNLGAMGILTDGYLGRAEAYSHGMIFALAPFLSDPAKYWD